MKDTVSVEMLQGHRSQYGYYGYGYTKFFERAF